MDFFWFLFIGLIAGWLAGKIMGGEHGIVGNILLGIAGSLIGGFLFRILSITAYGTIGPIVMAVIGAIVLIAAVRMLRRT